MMRPFELLRHKWPPCFNNYNRLHHITWQKQVVVAIMMEWTLLHIWLPHCGWLLCIPGICAYLTHSQLIPEMNSVWDPVAGESIISFTVDVSVAVAAPNGLITPIVSSADQRTIPEIAAVLRVSRGEGSSLMCG